VLSHTQNPFPPSDRDRHAIWTMLVERDIDAFLAAEHEAAGGVVGVRVDVDDLLPLVLGRGAP